MSPPPVIWNPTPKDEQLRALLDDADALPARGAALTAGAAQALAERVALKGIGRVAPNPLVGAVLVDRDHRFLAAGAHEKVGGPHAEIQALQALGATPRAALAGGTLYVTLEPCAHQSRTPACAPEVATWGLAKVVYGAVDPNPAVNGRGAAILADRGTAAVLDVTWQPSAERLAEIFHWQTRKGRPFVGLKAALSLDGAIARTGDRRAWITGERARSYGHFLRTHYDAMIVGQGTLIADDPTLDTRSALVPGREPIRVVLDPDGAALASRPDPTWRLLQRSPERVIWLVGDAMDASRPAKALAALGVDVVTLPVVDQLFDPRKILSALGERRITSVLLEGGAGVYGAFLAAGVVQRLHLFQSARLLGAAGTVRWTDDTGALTGPSLSATEITPLGDDWLVEGRLTTEEGS